MRIFTGIQPSGIAHLGNLFGAMLPLLSLAKKHPNTLVFLADLHALTTIHNPEHLRKYTLDLALDLLALGLDPEEVILFRQSDIPEHAELSWILSTVSPFGLLKRSHAFKDKIDRGIEASVGLFTYPILMAADILLYDPDLVPVGKDQQQHLEIARDIALKCNNTFGDIFSLPEPLISEETGVIPGRDGKKMSKSYGNTIDIFVSEKILKSQIMSIVTDSKTVEEKKEPLGNPIFELFSLFSSEEEIAEMAHRFRSGNFGYGEAKKILFEKGNAFLSPFRERRMLLANDPHTVTDILRAGAKKAKVLAEKKMAIVREKVGLSFLKA